MTIAGHIGKVVASAETAARATEFAQLAKFILAHRGNFSNAALAAETSSREGGLGPRLATIIQRGIDGISREVFLQEKVGITAGGLTASPLADFSAISSAFINSLVNVGAFDSMLSAMTPIPLATGTAGQISIGAQAFSLSEGSAKPISRLTVQNQQITPQKAHCVVVVTDELARTAVPGAVQLIQRALTNAVAQITDASFLAAMIAGLSPVASLGTDAIAVRQTIATLLSNVGLGQNSKPFLVTTSGICKAWCMLGSSGMASFPNLGPMGGSIQGIPVLVSDGVISGQVILLDASGIAGAPGEAALSAMREGVIISDSVPDSPVTGATVIQSLWQLNQSAIVSERWFAFSKLRSDAVAYASGVSNSPA